MERVEWFSGNGFPEAGDFSPGSLYLDRSAGAVYRWEGSAWLIEGHFSPDVLRPAEPDLILHRPGVFAYPLPWETDAHVSFIGRVVAEFNVPPGTWLISAMPTVTVESGATTNLPLYIHLKLEAPYVPYVLAQTTLGGGARTVRAQSSDPRAYYSAGPPEPPECVTRQTLAYAPYLAGVIQLREAQQVELSAIIDEIFAGENEGKTYHATIAVQNMFAQRIRSLERSSPAARPRMPTNELLRREGNATKRRSSIPTAPERAKKHVDGADVLDSAKVLRKLWKGQVDPDK